jgi:hypothetical protein
VAITGKLTTYTHLYKVGSVLAWFFRIAGTGFVDAISTKTN